jgi:hypothetical protein
MEDCDILCLETGTTNDVVDVLKKFIDMVSLIGKFRLVTEGFILITVSGYVMEAVVVPVLYCFSSFVSLFFYRLRLMYFY